MSAQTVNRPTIKVTVAWCLLVMVACVASAADSAEKQPAKKPAAKQIEFFEKRVRPILVKRCYDCHSGDSVESELRLDSLAGFLEGGTRGSAIVIGDPQKSLFIGAVNHADTLQMPPKEKLPTREIADLTKWVMMGAPWPNEKPITRRKKPKKKTGPLFTAEEKEFWAFQRPVAAALPAVRNRMWVRSPIDAFILAKLEAKGFDPAPPADKRTLIRRATFDLTGLPPTPKEVEAFLSDDSPQAFANVVDQLLASPRYGERWGRHWLDVARYADSNGLDENLAYANAYRYRDYVVAAFNKDKPYDRFVQEQLAGDLLPDNGDLQRRIECLTATGFLSLGAKMLAEDDPVKMQMDIIDEQIDTIGRAFMGLTLGCARCHRHKFDPIPTEDYYSLAGIFKSTKTMENFKVVARWQERPLATREETEHQQTIKRKVAEQKSQIEQLTKQADVQLLKEARRHVAAYLLAAEDQRYFDALLAQAKSVGAAGDPRNVPGLMIVEAEKFTRGNVKRDFSAYGKEIGVIINQGERPNVAEYDLTVKKAGLFQLELRYAAEESRSVALSINGKLVKSDAALPVTGSWYPETQTWVVEGFFALNRGTNTIRLERDGPFPHIDKLLLVPVPAGKDARVAVRVRVAASNAEDADQPKPEIVRQWAAYLKLTKSNPKSPFAFWHAFIAKNTPPDVTRDESGIAAKLWADPKPDSLGELADRYQQLFDQIERDWRMLKKSKAGRNAKQLPDSKKESLRQVLYDATGPFAVPKNAEEYYLLPTAAELKSHRVELESLEKSLLKLPEAMAVSDGEAEDLRVHIRGSHLTLGEVVPRRFLRIMAGEKQVPIGKTESGRLQLARWLTSPDHPLTSRVMVNRIWQGHFGDGLVRSPDNFGRLGERPTHPQLLDWLAVRFVEENWSMKAMHRAVMLSSTYRMSTTYNAAAASADPENRLFWRKNRRRLEAEAIRDSILAVAGNLDLTMGGSLLPTKNRAYVTSTENVDPVVYENNRRSIYLPVVRSALYEVFQAFDFADPSVPNGQRVNTTVAPQALFMMNSQIVSKQTKALAKLLVENATLDDAGRVRMIYEIAYSRPPAAEETDRALNYIKRYAEAIETQEPSETERRLVAWQSLCRAVLASNEFIFLE